MSHHKHLDINFSYGSNGINVGYNTHPNPAQIGYNPYPNQSHVGYQTYPSPANVGYTVQYPSYQHRHPHVYGHGERPPQDN